MPADAVVHLASPASPVDYERLPLETMAANSQGTWRLLDARPRGRGDASPTSRPRRPTAIRWSTPAGDATGATSTRSARAPATTRSQALRRGARDLVPARPRTCRAAIVRVFNTYGPAMRLRRRARHARVPRRRPRRPAHAWSTATAARPGRSCTSTTSSRPSCCVGLDPDADGQLLNVGNPEEVTILELAELIAATSCRARPSSTVPARPGDPQRRRPDIARITRPLRLAADRRLAEGLQRTAAWYREQVERPRTAARGRAHRGRPAHIGRMNQVATAAGPLMPASMSWAWPSAQSITPRPSTHRRLDSRQRSQHYVCVTGVHGVMESQRDPELRRDPQSPRA